MRTGERRWQTWERREWKKGRSALNTGPGSYISAINKSGKQCLCLSPPFSKWPLTSFRTEIAGNKTAPLD